MSQINQRRFFIVLLLALAMLVMAVGNIGSKPAQAQSSGSSPLLWPYNQPTSISYNINDVQQAWADWKAGQITSVNTGGDGRLRVMGGQSNSTTVSEGMGYGILFSSVMDDQQTLDGLWLFTKDYLDSKGLMNWYIGDPGQLLGTGAATDGDEDMALGMVNACVKVQHGVWQPSVFGVDYCNIANNLINAILTYETGPGGEVLPGDSWNMTQYTNGLVNLSYFAPGYYKVFGEFTNNQAAWNNVIARTYQIAQAAQNQPGNCSKLVPDWVDDSGVPLNPGFDANYATWSYDAMRFAWRISVDKTWYGTDNAVLATNEMGSYFASAGIANVKDQIQMDGTIIGANHNAFPVANDAAPIWAASLLTPVTCGAANGTLLSTPQDAYNEVLAVKETNSAYTYYNNAWRLFSMLLQTGNFPNIYEIGATIPTPTPTFTYTPGGPTITPTASLTPSNTPTLTATPTMTNTPSVGGLKIQIKTGDSTPQDNSQRTDFNVVVLNTSASPISGISFRLYYTADGSYTSNYTLEKWYDGSGVATISSAGTLVYGNIYYITVDYGSASLAPGANWTLATTLHTSDWSVGTYDASNDWWHTGYAVGALPTVNTDTMYIPAYINGALAWGNVPPSPVTVQIETSGNMNDNNQQTDFDWQVVNNTDQPISGISVRLYYTGDNGHTSDYTLEKWYDQSSSLSIATAGVLATGNVYYIQADYGTAVLQPHAAWKLSSTFHITGWPAGPYDASNDWWHTGYSVGQLPPTYQNTLWLPAYINGQQVWGNTPPVTLMTPTPSLTPTQITSVPTTGQVKVQLKIGDTNPLDNNQRTDFNYTIVNTSNSPVTGISVRLYYTADGTYGPNYTLENWYDGSGAAKISPTGTLAFGNVYYITVDYGTAILNTGASWTLATTLHLSDWSVGTYDASNDWWHTGFAVGQLPATYVDTGYIPAYVNGTLVWGDEPSAATNTPTFVPPTDTPLPTFTPTSTSTSTPTATPTNTSTFTPTSTNTPTANDLRTLVNACVTDKALKNVLTSDIDRGQYQAFINNVTDAYNKHAITQSCENQMNTMATYLLQHPTASPTPTITRTPSITPTKRRK